MGCGTSCISGTVAEDPVLHTSSTPQTTTTTTASVPPSSISSSPVPPVERRDNNNNNNGSSSHGLHLSTKVPSDGDILPTATIRGRTKSSSRTNSHSPSSTSTNTTTRHNNATIGIATEGCCEDEGKCGRGVHPPPPPLSSLSQQQQQQQLFLPTEKGEEEELYEEKDIGGVGVVGQQHPHRRSEEKQKKGHHTSTRKSKSPRAASSPARRALTTPPPPTTTTGDMKIISKDGYTFVTPRHQPFIHTVHPMEQFHRGTTPSPSAALRENKMNDGLQLLKDNFSSSVSLSATAESSSCGNKVVCVDGKPLTSCMKKSSAFTVPLLPTAMGALSQEPAREYTTTAGKGTTMMAATTTKTPCARSSVSDSVISFDSAAVATSGCCCSGFLPPPPASITSTARPPHTASQSSAASRGSGTSSSNPQSSEAKRPPMESVVPVCVPLIAAARTTVRVAEDGATLASNSASVRVVESVDSLDSGSAPLPRALLHNNNNNNGGGCNREVSTGNAVRNSNKSNNNGDGCSDGRAGSGGFGAHTSTSTSVSSGSVKKSLKPAVTSFISTEDSFAAAATCKNSLLVVSEVCKNSTTEEEEVCLTSQRAKSNADTNEGSCRSRSKEANSGSAVDSSALKVTADDGEKEENGETEKKKKNNVTTGKDPTVQKCDEISEGVVPGGGVLEQKPQATVEKDETQKNVTGPPLSTLFPLATNGTEDKDGNVSDAVVGKGSDAKNLVTEQKEKKIRAKKEETSKTQEEEGRETKQRATPTKKKEEEKQIQPTIISAACAPQLANNGTSQSSPRNKKSDEEISSRVPSTCRPAPPIATATTMNTDVSSPTRHHHVSSPRANMSLRRKVYTAGADPVMGGDTSAVNAQASARTTIQKVMGSPGMLMSRKQRRHIQGWIDYSISECLWADPMLLHGREKPMKAMQQQQRSFDSMRSYPQPLHQQPQQQQQNMAKARTMTERFQAMKEKEEEDEKVTYATPASGCPTSGHTPPHIPATPKIHTNTEPVTLPCAQIAPSLRRRQQQQQQQQEHQQQQQQKQWDDPKEESPSSDKVTSLLQYHSPAVSGAAPVATITPPKLPSPKSDIKSEKGKDEVSEGVSIVAAGAAAPEKASPPSSIASKQNRLSSFPRAVTLDHIPDAGTCSRLLNEGPRTTTTCQPAEGCGVGVGGGLGDESAVNRQGEFSSFFPSTTTFPRFQPLQVSASAPLLEGRDGTVFCPSSMTAEEPSSPSHRKGNYERRSEQEEVTTTTEKQNRHHPHHATEVHFTRLPRNTWEASHDQQRRCCVFVYDTTEEKERDEDHHHPFRSDDCDRGERMDEEDRMGDCMMDDREEGRRGAICAQLPASGQQQQQQQQQHPVTPPTPPALRSLSSKLTSYYRQQVISQQLSQQPRREVPTSQVLNLSFMSSAPHSAAFSSANTSLQPPPPPALASTCPSSALPPNTIVASSLAPRGSLLSSNTATTTTNTSTRSSAFASPLSATGAPMSRMSSDNNMVVGSGGGGGDSAGKVKVVQSDVTPLHVTSALTGTTATTNTCTDTTDMEKSAKETTTAATTTKKDGIVAPPPEDLSASSSLLSPTAGSGGSITATRAAASSKWLQFQSSASFKLTEDRRKDAEGEVFLRDLLGSFSATAAATITTASNGDLPSEQQQEQQRRGVHVHPPPREGGDDDGEGRRIGEKVPSDDAMTKNELLGEDGELDDENTTRGNTTTTTIRKAQPSLMISNKSSFEELPPSAQFVGRTQLSVSPSGSSSATTTPPSILTRRTKAGKNEEKGERKVEEESEGKMGDLPSPILPSPFSLSPRALRARGDGGGDASVNRNVNANNKKERLETVQKKKSGAGLGTEEETPTKLLPSLTSAAPTTTATAEKPMPHPPSFSVSLPTQHVLNHSTSSIGIGIPLEAFDVSFNIGSSQEEGAKSGSPATTSTLTTTNATADVSSSHLDEGSSAGGRAAATMMPMHIDHDTSSLYVYDGGGVSPSRSTLLLYPPPPSSCSYSSSCAGSMDGGGWGRRVVVAEGDLSCTPLEKPTTTTVGAPGGERGGEGMLTSSPSSLSPTSRLKLPRQEDSRWMLLVGDSLGRSSSTDEVRYPEQGEEEKEKKTGVITMVMARKKQGADDKSG